MNARQKRRSEARGGERGFTLIETTIGLVIMMIVALGSASLFAYSVRNNGGSNDRAQALAIAQQALETLRNARYTVTVTDTFLEETPASPPPPLVVNRDGRLYYLGVKVEDTTATLKTITLTVTPQTSSMLWSGESVTIVTLRARSDQP